MHSITLKSILNRVQPIKGFVYEAVTFSKVWPHTIEALVLPRAGSKARCSRCHKACPTYDHLETRTWTMPPLWTFALALFCKRPVKDISRWRRAGATVGV